MTHTVIKLRTSFTTYLRRPATLIVLKVSYYNAVTGTWVNKTAIEFTSPAAAHRSIRNGISFYSAYNVVHIKEGNIDTTIASFHMQGNNLEYKIKYELQHL